MSHGISRRYFRFDSPRLDVQIDGVSGKTVNWSIGGLALECRKEDLDGFSVDSTVSGHFLRQDGEEEIAFTGRVARIEANSKLMALEYASVSPEGVEMFAGIFKGMMDTMRGDAGALHHEGADRIQ